MSKHIWAFLNVNVKYYQLIPFGAVVIYLLYLTYATITGRIKITIKKENGETIKEFGEDTRSMRFSHGKKISQAGKELAGNDPYIIRNGNFRELVIFAPDHLQEFLRKDSKDHRKAKDFNMGDYAGRILGQCVGQQHGSKWKTMRSYFDPEFSHKSTLKMVPSFSKTIKTWVDGLATALDSAPLVSRTSKTAFKTDALKACKMLAFRLIATSIYGDALDENRFEELVNLSKLHGQVLVTAIFKPRTTSRFYNLLPTAEKKILDNYLTQWASFNSTVVKDARERKIPCPAEIIFNGVDSNDMTQVEFLQTLDEMLFSNIDITGTIMAFILINLAQNTEFRNKLTKEIVAEKAREGYKIIDYIAKQDTLLHYTTLESIRVTPAMWFSPPECTAVPKIIGGFQIPSGMPTVIDVRRLNTSPTIWGEDAEDFRPERFIGLNPSEYRYGLLRWGIGQGKCMGKNMADSMLKLVVVAVLERYSLHPAGGRDVSKEHYTIAVDGEIEFRSV